MRWPKNKKTKKEQQNALFLVKKHSKSSYVYVDFILVCKFFVILYY